MSLNLREIVINGPNPEKRFGHTITMIAKDRAVMFGGAVGDGIYKITNDTFSFDCKTTKWTILKPKNNEEAPTARAAHGSTCVETNQMVIFGGAHSHGNLVDNDLYLLKLSNNEANGKWVKVPIDGPKPLSRYGHVMVFLRPYILVIGGNIGNEPNNEVWSLSIDKSPFNWQKIEFTESQPQPRVYHSVSMWKNSNKGNMILIFGGRNAKNNPLDDLWGLRRHNNGVWDWVKAPSKNNKFLPMERYQHCMLIVNSLTMIIGGRNSNEKSEMTIDVYNLETSEWQSFPGLNRFRHVCWSSFNTVYIHGGFESSKPNLPTSNLSTIDLNELFAGKEDLIKNIEKQTSMMIEQPQELIDTAPGGTFSRYQMNDNVIVAHFNKDDKGMIQMVNLVDLPQEPSKISDKQQQAPPEDPISNLYNSVLKKLLKPIDWKYIENSGLGIKNEIILLLCDETIKVLRTTPSLINLRPGVKIFGSIHGQYGDLMRFFKQYGVPDTDPSNGCKSDIEALDYLFLGNYVDRGKNSLEVICLLFALKLKFPDHIHLIRGSHEDRKINFQEGLFNECESRLGEDPSLPNSVYNKINEVFEYLSFAAVIGKKILCIHSGIGVNLQTLDQIEKLKKPFIINHSDQSSREQKIVLDLLWSDPVLNEGDTQNQMVDYRDNIAPGMMRFGTDRIKSFLATNELQLIIRTHECVLDGAEEFGNTNLFTVFSCTDYGGVNNNDAAIFHYHKHNNQLVTYTINYQKGFSKWYNFPLKKGKDKKEDSIDPKDRPVTPPRRFTNNK